MTEAPLNHPSDEELRALSLGQLAEAELARVSAHLGDCPGVLPPHRSAGHRRSPAGAAPASAASRDEGLVGPAQRRSAVRALRQSHEARSATREPNTVSAILPAPRQVGDYDILGEVGRGGMGVVYKVRHRGLHRLAALKMVLAGEFASPAQELRFRLEAELAARVQHPNIVQVYEIGSYDGRPFLALEWVEGGSLADRLDGKPWPPARRPRSSRRWPAPSTWRTARGRPPRPQAGQHPADGRRHPQDHRLRPRPAASRAAGR